MSPLFVCVYRWVYVMFCICVSGVYKNRYTVCAWILEEKKCKNGTFLGFIARGCEMTISIQSDFEIDFTQLHSSGFIRVWFPSCFAKDWKHIFRD